MLSLQMEIEQGIDEYYIIVNIKSSSVCFAYRSCYTRECLHQFGRQSMLSQTWYSLLRYNFALQYETLLNTDIMNRVCMFVGFMIK